MESAHFIQRRGWAPRHMGSSPVADPDFGAAALASEMASSEHGDRDGGWSSALPQGLSVSGDGKRSSPCALRRRGLHCPITVGAHWVLSLLDLNKVFANMQGVKRTRVTPICLSELWGCDTKSAGTFHWKNKCPHSKIINAGIWAKVDQTERAGSCWGREKCIRESIGKDSVIQINLFPS